MSASQPPLPSFNMRDFARYVAELLVDKSRSEYQLGGVIDRVKQGQLWQQWPDTPFKEFDDWCWAILGLRKRKAKYFHDIFIDLNAMHLAEDTISRSLRIGWTKLVHILRVAKTEMALLKWIDRIEKHGLTEDDLLAEVRIAEARLKESVQTSASTTGVDNSDFSEDPTAREEDDEEDELEPASKKPRKKAGKRDPSHPSTEPPVKASNVSYKLAFSEDDFKIYNDAMKFVKRRTGDDELSHGKIVTLLAMHYLATASSEEEGGFAAELCDVMDGIERIYKVKVVVVEAPPAAQHLTEKVGAPVAVDVVADPIAAIMKPAGSRNDAFDD